MADADISSTDFERKCRRRGSGNIRHGFSGTRLESIYEKMRERCYNPKSDSYKRYGARGITVCEEWRTNPASFYAWATANGYEANLEIDRRQVHGGYSPENCRWVTHQENQNNRTNNTRLTFEGETLTLAQWARKTGINRTTLSDRHHKGWPVEQVLSDPKRRP